MHNSQNEKRVVNHAFKPSRAQVNFFLIALGFIMLIALLVVALSPQIQAWRRSVIDRLVSQAQHESDENYRLSLLDQAHLVDSNDPVATEALAQYWLSRGESAKAIAVYGSVDNPNYLRMGYLAQNTHDYSLALNMYKRASGEHQTAESLVGEATALYNQDKIGDGCEKALQAVKLSLQSTAATAAVRNCIILGGTQAEAVSLVGQQPGLNERETAYFLINNQVFVAGEKKLREVKTPTVTDWLVLSRLVASKGDIALAISQAEKGYALDPANTDILSTLTKLYTIEHNSSKAQEYSTRLQQLEFVKYQ